MNYFPFDPSPRRSAIALDDKRLPRVFHESVMVLSKIQYLQTGEAGPYSPRVPVPAALIEWAQDDGLEWFAMWTREMLVALNERFGAARVCGYRAYSAYWRLQDRYRETRKFDPRPSSFPNLARAQIKGLDYSDWDDTHAAYREYIRVQWNGLDKRPNIWTTHGPPDWAEDGIEAELRRLGLA